MSPNEYESVLAAKEEELDRVNKELEECKAKLKIARDALEFISENELIMDDMTYCSHAEKALKQLEET
jgi:DeoR/GlpR family transcriptional regulator of sugar metabolism